MGGRLERGFRHVRRPSRRRPPIGGETVAAEVIAATTVKARRLREVSRDDGAERRLLRQLLAFTPFGMSPPPPSPGQTYFVVGKGEELAPDGATVPDEASNNVL